MKREVLRVEKMYHMQQQVYKSVPDTEFNGMREEGTVLC